MKPLSLLLLALTVACEGSIGDVPPGTDPPPLCDGVECVVIPPAPPEPSPIDRTADVGYRPLTHLQIANTIASRLAIFEGREMDRELHDFVQLASHLRDQSATDRALAPVPFIDIAPVVIRAVERLIPNRRDALFGECATDADATNDDACRRQFLTDHGATFWRRPLTDQEATDLLAEFDAPIDDAQMRSLLIALMMSPQFLFVVEHGRAEDDGERRTELTAYELASRLSYFLWQDAPDPELLAAAADDSLLDAGVLAAQADRLLDDRRSERFFLAMTLGWTHIEPSELEFNLVGHSARFRYTQRQIFRRDASGALNNDGFKRYCDHITDADRLADCQMRNCGGGECGIELRCPAADSRCDCAATPDICFRVPITVSGDTPRPPDAEPGWRSPEYQGRLDFYDGLHSAIIDDLGAYVKHVVADRSGTVRDLFTLEVSAARDERVASLYDAPVWSGEGEAPSHPTGRGGLLGRIAFLANAVETTRPIIRGVRVWHHVLCREFAVPIPDNVVFRNPEVDRYTTRERVEFSTEEAGCQTCHGVLNEFAFALEGFDMLGQTRVAEPSWRVPGREGYQELGNFQPGTFLSEETLASLEDWLPIDSTAEAELTPGAPSPVSGAAALGEAIAGYQNADAEDDGTDAYSCLSRQLLRFGFDGAVVQPEEAQGIEGALRSGTIREAIQALVASGAFHERDFGEMEVAP